MLSLFVYDGCTLYKVWSTLRRAAMMLELRPVSTASSATATSLIHMLNWCTQRADDTDRITRFCHCLLVMCWCCFSCNNYCIVNIVRLHILLRQCFWCCRKVDCRSRLPILYCHWPWVISEQSIVCIRDLHWDGTCHNYLFDFSQVWFNLHPFHKTPTDYFALECIWQLLYVTL